MDRNSLFIRFALVIALITLVTGGVANLLMDQLIRKQTNDRITQEAAVILQSLDWAVSPMLENRENGNIQRLLNNVGSFRMIHNLRIDDPSGTILFSENPSEVNSKDTSIHVDPIIKYKKLETAYRDAVDAELVFAVPIRGKEFRGTQGTDAQAVLMLKVNNTYETALSKQVSNSLNIFILITDGLVLLFLSLAMYFYIARPLRSFREFSEKIAGRNYKARIESNTRFELKELASALNHMAEDMELYTHELSKAKADAEEQVRNKMQFFANMSHEIRTPLNSIIGFSELMEEDEHDPGKRARLGIVTRSGRHLMAIINDILDISKFELSHIVLEDHPFSLPELLLDLHRTYQPVAEGKRLRLQIHAEPGYPIFLRGDLYRIRQIFNNLIGNALKFTEKGCIEVNLQWQDGTLMFRVKDSGIGIPVEKHEHIFDAFAQADMSTTRMYGGTGLGLAICKRIADSMGGSIFLNSHVEKGSEFIVSLKLEQFDDGTVTTGENMVMEWMMHDIEVSDLVEEVIRDLPRRMDLMERLIEADDADGLEEAVHALKGVTGNFAMTELYEQLVGTDRDLKLTQAVTDRVREHITRIKMIVSEIPERYFTTEVRDIPVKPIEESGVSPVNILLAEDVPENRNLVQQILSRIDVVADEAEHGGIAVEMLMKKTYDLLLLDMHMPVMDGLEVLKLLRSNKQFDDLQIIALTASTQKEQVEEYLQYGCNKVIPKPVDKELIRRTVLELIAEKTLKAL